MSTLSAKERIIYQIYPKSFKDSNGDGIGDLKGITAKLKYLKQLGINTIWLNPIYVSPQIDNGYDVADYYQIDEKLGTMADFDELVAKAHALGLDIILDFVMNHTSDQHPWFQATLKDKDSEFRNCYLWHQGKNGGPPNNWGSFFGGSVWQKDPLDSNNYYFHLFAKEMPDLNWAEPKVQVEMLKIAKFWLEHGVDGFRLDAFIHIAKADFEQDMLAKSAEPQIAEMFYANLPQVQVYLKEFIAQLHQIKPDIFILGEAASADIDLAVDYTTPKKESCDTVVTFRYFAEDKSQVESDLPQIGQPVKLDILGFRSNMLEWQKRLEGVSYPTLYWSNHDMPRILSRFAPKKESKACAKMLATLMYLQRGIACIYYGEELGMRSQTLGTVADFEDPQIVDFAKQAKQKGWRDGEILRKASQAHKMAARLPLPFDTTAYAGFSNVQPWKWSKEKNVASIAEQMSDPDSVLNFYRQILQLKQKPVFIEGRFILENTSSELYVYRRVIDEHKQVLVICNLSEHEKSYPCGAFTKVLLSQNAKVSAAQAKLAPYGSLILQK